MPYASIEELPSSIRDNLPVHGQHIYLSAFNSAFDSGASEESCHEIAWSAVKKVYRQDASGAWQPIKEAGMIESTETTEFEETTAPAHFSRNFIREDGTARVRIIKPGWGSSGYYSEQMLQRDASKVYSPGLHMYLDHPTTAEEKARPERSLKDLAGVIEDNVRYEAEGPVRNPNDPNDKGQGVYADVHVLSQFRGMINEMAPYIGISHRAAGKSRAGEAEGRKGQIIESLEKAYSADFVTLPGAGGGLVQMFESWREDPQRRKKTPPIREDTMESKDITLKLLQENRPDLIDQIKTTVLKEVQESESEKKKDTDLLEAQKKIKVLEETAQRYAEKEALEGAKGIVTEALKTAKVPELAKPRIVEALIQKATLKDGKLDETAFKTTVTDALREESAFYGKLMETGKVRGLGEVPPGNDESRKALQESFERDFLEAGKPPEVAKKMAEVAARGR